MNYRSLILQQFSEVQKIYPNLKLEWCVDGGAQVIGEIVLCAEYKEIPLMQSYSIKILIPVAYPNLLPVAYELSGKIPKGFSHQYQDGGLCLGVETDLYHKFTKEPTLIFFIQHFLLNYLYAACYFERYGRAPFGERSHGNQGVIEYYLELFDVDAIEKVMNILKIIALSRTRKVYRGHLKCPCGSGVRLRDCHGKQILLVLSEEHIELFARDYTSLAKWLNDQHRTKIE